MSARVGRHRLLLLLGAALAVAFAASRPPVVDLAHRLVAWTGGGAGGGSVHAEVLPSAAAPTGSAIGTDVSLSWSPVVMVSGAQVDGYEVRRYDLDGTLHATLDGCDGLVTGTMCTELGVPVGSWRYALVTRSGSWTAVESPRSTTIAVGGASLGFTSSTTITALPATLQGAVSGFRASEGLTFHLDAEDGPVLAGTPSAVGPDGTATVSVTLPAGTDDSPHAVVAVGDGGTVARAAVSIVDPPSLVALEAFDVDRDGRVDRVAATFDEPLAAYTAGTAPWALSAAPSGATLASVSVSGAVATLELTEGTGAATTALGSFKVALGVSGTGVRDANGHRSSFPATAPVDRAAPALLSATMSEAVVNGRVDRITLTFSETLAAASSGTAPLTLASVPSGGTAASLTTSGTTATIGITEGPGAPDTAVGDLTVALAPSATGIRDAAGNPSSFAARAPADAAAPVAVSRLGYDVDANGRFDRVVVAFSEALAPYGAGTAGWGLSSAPSGATLGSVSASGTTATLALTEGTGTRTTAVGSFRLSLTKQADGIRDAAGNQTSFASSSATAVADRAGPVPNVVSLLDGTTSGNGNGKVDRVTVTWTETISTTYAAGTALWTLTDVPSGGTLASVGLTTSTVTLTLTEGTGAADTAVGAMRVAMGASASGVRDGSGNPAPAFAPVAPRDQARAVPLDVTDTNGATDGRVEPGDTLSLRFSEPLAAASVPSTSTVTLADPTGTGNDTLSIAGITNGARSTGSNAYVTTDATSASWPATVALSADRTTITVTVGSTCTGTGCAGLGTATSAASFSYLGATTLDDGTIAVTTGARTFSRRLF
ncbi:hypothetical protein PO878_03740 [Iamia majanohamensis]|uniref:Ig-like domain-containing protein n=1 Tax=Iamia majanohamensis TaxID=467976 RepID=A0AAE9Y6I5_9ACTN|nr:hypothetical protein [Iamia majanohamensis]WCO67835.1 hypothetical protein PO878_03740 [Iamia majanohamensis]